MNLKTNLIGLALTSYLIAACGTPLEFPSDSASSGSGSTADEATTAPIASSPWKRFAYSTVANQYADIVTVRSDIVGNVVVIGDTNTNLRGNTLSGTKDVIIQKYSPSGELLFTKQYGVAGGSWSGAKIYTDSHQNIYAGMTLTLKDLDGNSISNNVGVVRKLDKEGTQLWVKQLTNGGTAAGYVSITGVVGDNDGNAYVSGVFQGGIEGTAATGTTDGFLLKLNTTGAIEWQKTFGQASKTFSIYHLSLSSTGLILVPGQTSMDISSSGYVSSSPFLMQYDSSGNQVHLTHLGSTNSNKNVGTMGRVVEGSDGSLYGCGITSTPDFNGLTSIGTTDIIFYKFTKAGELVWVNRHGQSGVEVFDAPECLAIGKGDRLYSTGTQNGTFANNALIGTKDVWIAELSSTDGSLVKSHSFGIAGATIGRYTVDADRSGNLYTSFSFSFSFMGHTLVGTKAALVGRTSLDTPFSTLEALPYVE